MKHRHAHRKRPRRSGFAQEVFWLLVQAVIAGVVALLVTALIVTILIRTGAVIPGDTEGNLPRFADPEWASRINFNSGSILLFILLFLLLVLLAIVRYVLRMKWEVNRIVMVCRLLRNGESATHMEESQISEFQEIRDSVIQMDQELVASIARQNQIEQERKYQISMLAHDINTPITIIQGNSELLEMTPLSREQQEYNAEIQKAADTLYHYSREIILYSKSEDPVPLAKREVSIHEIVDTLTKMCSGVFAFKNIEHSIEYHEIGPDATVSVHLMFLARALLNAVGNACEHVSDGGRVTIAVGVEDHYVRFQVIDNGPGFSEQELAQGVQLFYRESGREGRERHYGMGLAFASRVCEHHGGCLRIENSPVEGGVVTFLIEP